MPTSENSIQQDVKQVFRGMLMGGADIIPGVSGGTMALILGIYERLVTAISHVDLRLLGLLRRRDWAAAARHLDLRFLIALGCGIVGGIVIVGRLMHWLLAHHATATWSLLFGLILASGVLVGMMVERWDFGSIVSLLVGAVAAFFIVGMVPKIPPDGYWYVFVCGAVAICAMILPGISGAFILVIMGMYFHVTGILHDLSHGAVTGDGLTTVVIFCAGCATGLLSFSKLLRTLLNHYEAATMAMMCGFLFGSLRKIWPFKEPLTAESAAALGLPVDQLEKLHKYRLGPDYFPSQLNGEVLTALAMFAAGLLAVLLLDRLTRGHEHVPPVVAEDHES
ncbi:MAG: DUF368 domain-containing protein [Planctomycetales bacterium]|nr:DUF368 domain-containing protein [Planctomycetales bacterium]